MINIYFDKCESLNQGAIDGNNITVAMKFEEEFL